MPPVIGFWSGTIQTLPRRLPRHGSAAPKFVSARSICTSTKMLGGRGWPPYALRYMFSDTTAKRSPHNWMVTTCATICLCVVLVAAIVSLTGRDQTLARTVPAGAEDPADPADRLPEDRPTEDRIDEPIDPKAEALPRWTEPPPQDPVRYAFVGDVHGEGGVGTTLEGGDNPFQLFVPALEDADVTVANLETAVATEGTAQDKQYVFNAPLNITDMMAVSGIDVVSLANNHSMDYGAEAMLETRARAEGSGLAVVGAGENRDHAFEPHMVDVDGLSVAIVATSRLLPRESWFATTDGAGVASAYDLDDAVEAVWHARQNADRVVVFVHWGDELAACPNQVQRTLADAFVAAGADVIVGHHPHVLQGVETRGHALIAYSVGNFAFYARDHDAQRTGVLQVDQAGDETSWHLVPGVINDGIPTPVHDDAAAEVLETIEARSPGGAAGCEFG